MSRRTPPGSPLGSFAVTRPRTFSKRIILGFNCSARLTNSKKSLPRGSSMPRCRPAELKGWHGGPPARTSGRHRLVAPTGRKSAALSSAAGTWRSRAPSKWNRPSWPRTGTLDSCTFCRVFMQLASTSVALTVWNPARSRPRSSPPAPEKSETSVGFLSLLGVVKGPSLTLSGSDRRCSLVELLPHWTTMDATGAGRQRDAIGSIVLQEGRCAPCRHWQNVRVSTAHSDSSGSAAGKMV